VTSLPIETVSFETVKLDTSAGEIRLTLRPDLAPIAVCYVTGLIDAGAYDGTTLYRASTLGQSDGSWLVQGGPFDTVLAEVARDGDPRVLPTLSEFETTDESGLQHRRGVVSLGRDLPGDGSVIADMFFCLGTFTQLDRGGRTEPDERGFPAFAQVDSGLDVLDRIAASETAGPTKISMLEGQILTEPVVIHSAVRL